MLPLVSNSRGWKIFRRRWERKKEKRQNNESDFWFLSFVWCSRCFLGLLLAWFTECFEDGLLRKTVLNALSRARTLRSNTSLLCLNFPFANLATKMFALIEQADAKADRMQDIVRYLRNEFARLPERTRNSSIDMFAIDCQLSLSVHEAFLRSLRVPKLLAESVSTPHWWKNSLIFYAYSISFSPFSRLVVVFRIHLKFQSFLWLLFFSTLEDNNAVSLPTFFSFLKISISVVHALEFCITHQCLIVRFFVFEFIFVEQLTLPILERCFPMSESDGQLSLEHILVCSVFIQSSRIFYPFSSL